MVDKHGDENLAPSAVRKKWAGLTLKQAAARFIYAYWHKLLWSRITLVFIGTQINSFCMIDWQERESSKCKQNTSNPANCSKQ